MYTADYTMSVVLFLPDYYRNHKKQSTVSHTRAPEKVCHHWSSEANYNARGNTIISNH